MPKEKIKKSGIKKVTGKKDVENYDPVEMWDGMLKMLSGKPGPTPLVNTQLGLALCRALADKDGKFSEKHVKRAIRWAHSSLVDLNLLVMLMNDRASLRFKGKQMHFRAVSPEERAARLAMKRPPDDEPAAGKKGKP